MNKCDVCGCEGARVIFADGLFGAICEDCEDDSFNERGDREPRGFERWRKLRRNRI